MQLQEKQVILRKLVASEGKILVSKTLDEEGNPTVKSKEIYLADGASENDFEEIDEIIKQEGENKWQFTKKEKVAVNKIEG